MLLALDVGNTNIVLGLYRLESSDLVAHWRIATARSLTADECGMFILNLFALEKIDPAAVTAMIVASVVPPLEPAVRQAAHRYFHVKPMFVEPGIKTGMPTLVDNPAELGADRIANAVAAYSRYGGPGIVVDFGTATTFDVISKKGEYLGGAIAPGLGISAEALFSRAARLSRVDIKKPSRAIGSNTIAHLQSGMYFGYIGLVDGILERMIEELGVRAGNMAHDPPPVKVVSTGGLSHLIAGDSRYISAIDDTLTLEGLRLIYQRNLAAKAKHRAEATARSRQTGRPLES